MSRPGDESDSVLPRLVSSGLHPCSRKKTAFGDTSDLFLLCLSSSDHTTREVLNIKLPRLWTTVIIKAVFLLSVGKHI